MKKLSVIFVLSWVILILAGCSTTKKKSEGNVKGLKKSMHDLSARFNGYHNAKIILKESFTNLSGQQQDNYNQILPLYREAAVEDAQSVSGQLDEAIKKSSIVIALHRPSKWTDDAYLLIGQAQYLKQNYDEAAETFDYIIKEFSPENIYEKKRAILKKSKNKKKRSAASRRLKPEQLEEELAKKKYHRTVQRDAKIWKARTLIELGQFDQARFILDKLPKDEKFSQKQQAQIAATDSYYHLKQEDYAKSIEPLNKAIELTKNKKQKTRYVYILAQIYQQQGNQEAAAIAYKQVLGLRPLYDMEFRTRLNMIINEWASKKTDAKSTLTSLKRMSKDIKNEEFRDQIFFAMADVAIADGQQDEAVDYLKQSLAYNATNRPQKAESYLKLAQIYFEQQEYVFSKRYYDSTMLVLPTNDARYTEVSEYTASLTDIATQIETLSLNDSLVMISKMSDDERMTLAKKLKKEKLDQQGNDPVAATRKPAPASALPSASAIKSKFFAYDPAQVKRGMREFEKIWGDRALEDNWRRSDQSGGVAATLEEEVDELASVKLTEAEMKVMFKDVPDSPADFEKMDKENIEALFLLGNLFRDRIDKADKAIETFEELLKRYPDNKHDLEAMYSLYLLLKDKGDRQANYYKKEILKKYPDSKHAKAIENPGALADLEDSDVKLDKYYSSTFDLYENGDFEGALAKINQVDKVFGDANTLQPKFALLMALCTGNINGKDAYVKALTGVIQTHPGTEEATKAQEFLSYIGADAATPKTVAPDGKKPKSKKDLFVAKPDDQHYIVVILDDKNVKLDKVKEAISDYNKDAHKLENLKISSLMLNLESSVLIIRRFSDEKKAMKYWNEVKGKKDKFLNGLDPEAQVYPLSQSNYKTLLRIREVEPYLEYCAETYK